LRAERGWVTAVMARSSGFSLGDTSVSLEERHGQAAV
jgi:hypothetical protein